MFIQDEGSFSNIMEKNLKNTVVPHRKASEAQTPTFKPCDSDFDSVTIQCKDVQESTPQGGDSTAATNR